MSLLRMNLLGFELHFWYLVIALLVVELSAVGLFCWLSYIEKRDADGNSEKRLSGFKLLSVREKVYREIARLQSGGEMDESLLNGYSADEKALFEVAVIDVLTNLPREEQRLLRAALTKHGYDDICARRQMRGDMSDRIRASTLLYLLRPQTGGKEGA